MQYDSAVREEHRVAHEAVTHMPATSIHDPFQWTPPYAWNRFVHDTPAIFSHPMMGKGSMHFRQEPIQTAPIFSEWYYDNGRNAAPSLPIDQNVQRLLNEHRSIEAFRVYKREDQPIPAYNPASQGGGNAPSVVVPNVAGNPPLSRFLESVHLTQQMNMRRRTEASPAASSTDAVRLPSQHTPFVSGNATHRYLGDDTSCSICLAGFQRGERVYRIQCDHRCGRWN